ncbi:transmembrane protein 6/97, partial [Syncephalis plumigaleata]
RVTDYLLFGYFLSHIPASLLIDTQVVLPPSWIPSFLSELRAWYAYTTGDPFMRPDQPAGAFDFVWFRGMVVCELCFQLPLMLLAVQIFCPWTKQASANASTAYPVRVRNLRRWRVPLLAFGVHTATTLVPILAELYAWPTVNSSTTADAAALLYSFYVPYLLGPL